MLQKKHVLQKKFLHIAALVTALAVIASCT